MKNFAFIAGAVCLSSGCFATTLTLSGTADDAFDAYISTSAAVQGSLFMSHTSSWSSTSTGSVALTANVTNYLHVHARDIFGVPSMFIATLGLSDANFVFSNSSSTIDTNATDWLVTTNPDYVTGAAAPFDLGQNGTQVWGLRQGGISSTARHLWFNQAGGGDAYFTLESQAVPEPATMSLLGLAGVALLRRRFGKKS